MSFSDFRKRQSYFEGSGRRPYTASPRPSGASYTDVTCRRVFPQAGFTRGLNMSFTENQNMHVYRQATFVSEVIITESRSRRVYQEETLLRRPKLSSAAHVYRNATLTGHLSVSLEYDDFACDIAGIALVRDKIIVADKANFSLKVFNRAYSFLFEHKCNKSPEDIDKFSYGRFVVTWGCNLTLNAISNDKIVELIKIKNNYICKSLCCYDEKIYCVVHYTRNSWEASEICVYTPDGILRRRIEYLSDGRRHFNSLQYITVNPNTSILYVTDWEEGVVALTTKGEFLTRISPRKLRNPQGIASDCYGQIYVCGVNSHNLLQISADGRETVELLSSSARCSGAQCVKVLGSVLFLGRRRSGVLSIYKLSRFSHNYHAW